MGHLINSLTRRRRLCYYFAVEMTSKTSMNMSVLSLILIHSMPQLRKFAQVYKVAQTMWCKEAYSLPAIRRELNHFNAGQKKSAMPPNSNYENYDWKQAAVNAILLQTSNPKLWRGVLQYNVSYEDLLKFGIRKEQSEKGAVLLEKASGQSSSQEQHYAQEVRRPQHENRKCKCRLPKKACGRYGFDKCEQGQK